MSTSSLFPPGRCSVITYRAHIHLKRLSLMFACLLIFLKPLRPGCQRPHGDGAFCFYVCFSFARACFDVSLAPF